MHIVECKSGYFGINCSSECEAPRYGLKCSQKCENCSRCHHISGCNTTLTPGKLMVIAVNKIVETFYSTNYLTLLHIQNKFIIIKLNMTILRDPGIDKKDLKN